MQSRCRSSTDGPESLGACSCHFHAIELIPSKVRSGVYTVVKLLAAKPPNPMFTAKSSWGKVGQQNRGTEKNWRCGGVAVCILAGTVRQAMKAGEETTGRQRSQQEDDQRTNIAQQILQKSTGFLEADHRASWRAGRGRIVVRVPSLSSFPD